jgi:Flp pilus assembly protein TadG
MRCPRRLFRDSEGAAALEAVIVIPLVLLFMMVLIEMSLLTNARQLANYAAFSAARTASVHGVGDSAAIERTHLAAAMAMSPISPPQPTNPAAVLSACGIDDPDLAVKTLCAIPGFEGHEAEWSRRVADAFIRTSVPDCSTGTASGKTRRHIVVDVVYIYRCNILPLGIFWGHSRLDKFVTGLEGLSYYETIKSVAAQIQSSWRWNVPIHGRAVTEYWVD